MPEPKVPRQIQMANGLCRRLNAVWSERVAAIAHGTLTFGLTGPPLGLCISDFRAIIAPRDSSNQCLKQTSASARKMLRERTCDVYIGTD